MRMSRTAGAGFGAFLTLLGLPGCIAWEIRDEIHAANQRIDEVDGVLIQTSHSLEKTNEGIARTDELLEQVQGTISTTNAQISEIQARIEQTTAQIEAVHASLKSTEARVAQANEALGKTNPSLITTNEGIDRLRMLDEMHMTLRNIETALAPLQKTMASLGSTMSFFGLGGEEPAAAPADDAQAPHADAAVAADAPAQATAPEPRMVAGVTGTWILAHPAPAASSPGTTGPAEVLVLLSNARFVEAGAGKIRASGTWARDGDTLTLTPATAGASAARFEIVSVSGRALTVRSGDDVRVYARP